MDRYAAKRIPQLAKTSQRSTRYRLGLLRAVFGHMRPAEATPQDIYGYLAKRPHVSGQREKALLSTIFYHAIEWGAAQSNPCKSEQGFFFKNMFLAHACAFCRTLTMFRCVPSAYRRCIVRRNNSEPTTAYSPPAQQVLLSEILSPSCYINSHLSSMKFTKNANTTSPPRYCAPHSAQAGSGYPRRPPPPSFADGGVG
jgi:hypothetical protein